MAKQFLKLLSVLLFICGAFLCVNGQISDASTPSGRPDPSKEDLPVGIKETLAKQRINSEKKEFQELLARGEEAAKLGDELSKSWDTAQRFSPEDEKKLDRLEKLVKKIRSELGAENDGESKEEIEVEKPSTLQRVVKNIKEDTANLLSEIKKISRFTISVVAIESSNTLLKLVRFLRFNKK